MNTMITVFTPTYNRCHTLHRLYDSLCRQTRKNFTWIVIDDGSTDDTKNYIKQCKGEKLVDIVYCYQKNAGKHVAFNTGVNICETELFFCVDSDDYLTDDAIDKIQTIWQNHDKTDIAGVVANRGFEDGRLIGTKFPEGVEYDTLSGLYKKGKKGDTALIYRTDVLRMYPFPVFAGESFIRESIVYNQIDEKYKLLVLPYVIYIGEYLEDGLSKNARKHDEESPNGAALYRLDMFKKAGTIKDKFSYGVAYCYFMDKAGRKREIDDIIGVRWGRLCRSFLWLEKIRRTII